jgi:polar amino acid transport system permease protein
MAAQPGLINQEHLAMGENLANQRRRAGAMDRLRLSIVWLVLVALLILALLQLNIEPGYMVEHYDFVLQGLLTTLAISFVSIILAAILALFGALGRLSKSAIARGVSAFYVSVIRGTPLLIQIYLIYLGLPQLGNAFGDMGLTAIRKFLILPAFWAGVTALSLNYGAYMTEIFRAGLQSVSHGQWEAASAIGMTRSQALRRVILPQAIRIIIPAVGNQFIAMQKDSSLVSVMGVWEMTYRANRFARQDSRYIEMFVIAAALYWILTIISTWFQSQLENSLERAYQR